MKKILSILLSLAMACTFLSLSASAITVDVDISEADFEALLAGVAARANIDDLLTAYLADAEAANTGLEVEVGEALEAVDADAIDAIIEDLITDYLADFLADNFGLDILEDVISSFLADLGDDIISALDAALVAESLVTPTLFAFGLEAVLDPVDITGPAAKTLIVGYAAASSDAFTMAGFPAPTVRIVSGDAKITWNDGTCKLDIAAGLAIGTYPVVLEAYNFMDEARFTFTLTVDPAAPTITGPAAMTVTVGYAATSSGAFTVTGDPAPTVSITGDAAITWNAGTGKLDIAEGLEVGVYSVTLTASNGTAPDGTATFTLTVEPTFCTKLWNALRGLFWFGFVNLFFGWIWGLGPWNWNRG